MWLNDIDPELEVIPLLDSGTDCQDELSSPDGSPMVISPIVGLLPSQGEDDINLSLILAEFANRPALLSPIDDQYQQMKVPTGWAGRRCQFDQRHNSSGFSEISVPNRYVA